MGGRTFRLFSFEQADAVLVPRPMPVSGWSERFRIAVDYSVRGTQAKRFRADVEINLYRLAREALHNTVKHACATRVRVSLEHHDADSVLVIVDDGRGFDVAGAQRPAAAGTLGLVSMRERAALAGGEFHIESTPGGTWVRVRVPVLQ